MARVYVTAPGATLAHGSRRILHQSSAGAARQKPQPDGAGAKVKGRRQTVRLTPPIQAEYSTGVNYCKRRSIFSMMGLFILAGAKILSAFLQKTAVQGIIIDIWTDLS